MDKDPGFYYVPDNSLSPLGNYYCQLVELTFSLINLLINSDELFNELPFKFDINPYKGLTLRVLRDFLFFLDKCELWDTVFGSEDRVFYDNVIQHYDGYC